MGSGGALQPGCEPIMFGDGPGIHGGAESVDDALRQLAGMRQIWEGCQSRCCSVCPRTRNGNLPEITGEHLSSVTHCRNRRF